MPAVPVNKKASKPAVAPPELTDGSDMESDVDNQNSSSSGEEEDEDENDKNPRGAAARNAGRGNAKAVSAAEVRAARETSETFRSNVFKLQVDEVLKEIAVEEKYASQARKILFTLREKIAATSAVGPYSYTDAQRLLTTRIPYPRESFEEAKSGSDIKYKFGFVPPSLDTINVIGSWSLHTTIRRPSGPVGIDLLVPMSGDLFESKDYLDYRYLRKRAFFLAVLASQLAEAGLPLEPRFEKFNGHSLKPTLQLIPVGPLAKLGKRVVIYVHVGPDDSVRFPLSKLAPHRNANRAVDGPTPVYNWSVLSDICSMPLLRFLHATSASAPAFADAARLGSLWLQQRRWGSDSARGGFGSFEFTLLLAFLLNGGSASGKKRLLSGFSSYQLFKGTLLYIAESERISLEANISDRTCSPLADSTENMLFVTDYELNALANMAPWASKKLRHDAQLAVDMLNDGTCDRFSALFLRDCGNPKLVYDVEFEVDVNSYNDSQTSVDVARQLHDILHRAWGPRYKAMMITPAKANTRGSLESSWPLSSDVPVEKVDKFIVGAVLDPDNAEKRVTFVGPEVNNDSAEFKAFWGQKASLRRFQDGMIKDAVVWSFGLRPIAQEAAIYALSRHMDVEVILPQLFERKLPFGNDPIQKIGTGFLALNQSFQKLGQLLQDMRSALPLRIMSVFGTSAELRSASIQEPQPFNPSQIAEGLIEMETSSRWPADLEATEKVKSAFLIKIAESIRQLHPQYYVVIGLEPSIEDPSVEAAFAIIQTPEGFYFKFRLLARTARSGPTKLTDLADHTRLMSSMVSRFPSLSTSMRLVKYWLERQMLMTHISEPAAELLALYVYANSAPWAPPVCPTTAFWRVIDVLSKWDWRESQLIIDTERHVDNSQQQIDEIAAGCDMDYNLFQSITSAFVKQRKQDPALTEAPWSIATKLDHAGTLWTSWKPRSRVAPLIASRVTALARAAKPGVRIFDVSTTDFDVAWNVTSPQMFSTKNKNLVVSDPHKAIIGSHNVAKDLIEALNRLYKDTLVLFYSGSISTAPSKRNVLCGIWNRQILDPLPKLRASVNYPLRETKRGYELDKEAVLLEIERLGSGILERIR